MHASLPHLPWANRTVATDRPALADERIALTRDELLRCAERFAQRLRAEGVSRGDIVAVMLPNRVELVIALFGAWWAGAAVTPVNPTFTDAEAAHQLEDSGAVLVVCEDPARLSGRLTAVSAAEVPTTASATVAGTPTPLTPTDLALVIYTSGSTGRPKGVMLDHANLEAMTAQMLDAFRIGADDHCLLVLPLFHVNAIAVSILTPLRAGARTTVLERFAPASFADAVERVRPTYFSCVPTILAGYVDQVQDATSPASSVRFVICGAAPASRELLVRAEHTLGVPIVEGYGLTEATCASACNPIEGDRRVGTVGPALPGQRIRIVGDDGAEVPAGERGEVRIAGPTVMRGYLGRPEATRETVVDGWLCTGDVGVLDEDGYLSLVDRIKDMIIRGGENIYPKEIETVLHGVDGVAQAAVVGRPDPRLGEVPVARVVLHPGSALTAEDLLDHCRARLTKIKVPVELTLVDRIPTNPVGKIDKPLLRAEAAEAARAAEAEAGTVAAAV